MVKNPPGSARDVRAEGLAPRPRRSPGGGPGNSLQYSCLENPMDRGTRWATVPSGCKELGTTERLCMHAERKAFWKLLTEVQFSSVTESCPTLCNPMNCSTPGLPVSCLQCFPASGSFQISELFTSDGQCIGVSASASVLPMNIQDSFL